MLVSKLYFSLLLGVILCVASAPRVLAADRVSLRHEAASAFALVAEAENSGGNATFLTLKLDEAVRIIDSGSDAQLPIAEALISEVKTEAPAVGSAGSQAVQTQIIVTGVVLVVLGTSAVLVWLYGSRVFWGLWLRSRGGWRVERG
jgi:hypothetical protein